MFYFNQTNIEKKLCVDNKVQETIGDACCPTYRTKKSVHISANKVSGFYNSKKCDACCYVLKIPFKVQKRNIMLFGDDGTHCFAKKTSRDYEKGTHLHFWRNSSTNHKHTQTRTKIGKNHSIYGIIVSTPHWLMQLTKPFFASLFIHFHSKVKQHAFLNLQRRYWVVSRL